MLNSQFPPDKNWELSIGQIFRKKASLPVILADVLEDFAAGHPRRGCLLCNGPAAGPRCGVRSRVVDGHLVRECFEVRAGNALDKVQLVRARICPIQPLFLVETYGVDHQRVTFPLAGGVTQIGRAQIITGWVRASVHVNDPPGMRSGDVEYEDTLQLRHIYNLKPRCIKERRSTARLAAYQRGV